MTRPVLLLDVDGVLNALRPASHHTRYPNINGWPFAYDPTIIERIGGWHGELVEVRWLTTWEEQANKHLAPIFGWTDFEVAGIRPRDHRLQVQHGFRWWKSTHAEAVYAAGHRVVWCDDELVHASYNDDLGWAKNVPLSELLLVCSDAATGLTHADLDMVEQWVHTGSATTVEEEVADVEG